MKMRAAAFAFWIGLAAITIGTVAVQATVSTTAPRNDYIGTGATATYSYTFKVFAATDLRVTTRTTANVESTLTYLTDYTVTGVGNKNGGTITLTAGNLTTDYALTIRFDRVPRQSTDLRNQGSFFAETHEEKFDELTRYAQQLDDVVDRSLHLPETEVGTAAKTTLPVAADRASKYLAWDGDGNPIASVGSTGDLTPVSSFMNTVLDDATARAARLTLGAAETGWEVQHYTVVASVESNALNITLTNELNSTPSATNPVKLRVVDTSSGTQGNYLDLSIEAALSLVISNGSTLGTVSGVASRLYIGVAYDAGTARLFAYNPTTSAGNVVNLSDYDTYSSTAEGGAGTADSAQVLYSGTAFTTKHIRLLGYVESTQATAGTWATNPSKTVLLPHRSPAPVLPTAVTSKACDGRLTLQSGTAISTTDQLAIETLYFTPFRGDELALYDGTTWRLYTLTELSVDVPDVTGVHDVFVYDNAGVLTLDVVVWTNDTTRATALVLQNGVYVKNGATNRRYVGTFYSTSAGNGQIEDSAAKRYLWNYYNRVDRQMYVRDITNTWTYSVATWRQANGSTANQLDFVIGVIEEPVQAQLIAHVNSSNSSAVAVGIGADTTTASSAQMWSTVRGDTGSSHILVATSQYSNFPSVGKHYLAWLEWSTASGTTTWYGDNGGTELQSGILGRIRG
ncbi:MAG: hypothetical protein ACYCZR_00910 [Burkholderiales bacterium]